MKSPITDLKLQTTKPKKGSQEEPQEFWSFSLRLVSPLAPAWEPWPVSGWKYWPSSGEVKPPMFRRGSYWFPTIKGFTTGQSEEVAKWVRAALREKGVTENIGPVDRRFDRFDDAGDSQAEHVKLWYEYGAEYPLLYRQWAGSKAEDPTAWDLLWQQLPEGRTWPDELLEYTAANLKAGSLSVDHFEAAVGLGVFSFADREWLLRRLAEMIEEVHTT